MPALGMHPRIQRLLALNPYTQSLVRFQPIRPWELNPSMTIPSSAHIPYTIHTLRPSSPNPFPFAFPFPTPPPASTLQYRPSVAPSMVPTPYPSLQSRTSTHDTVMPSPFSPFLALRVFPSLYSVTLLTIPPLPPHLNHLTSSHNSNKPPQQPLPNTSPKHLHSPLPILPVPTNHTDPVFPNAPYSPRHSASAVLSRRRWAGIFFFRTVLCSVECGGRASRGEEKRKRKMKATTKYS